VSSQPSDERYRYLSARLKMATEASMLCLESGDFAGLSAAIAEQRDIALEMADHVGPAEKANSGDPSTRASRRV
jgi:hypothetical protein